MRRRTRKAGGSARRLAGSDAGFLYIESESQTSTCTQALVLAAPGPGERAVSLDEVRTRIADRIDRVPHLRRRLHQVPGGIGHAVWADDPLFDLDDHVSHTTLDGSALDAHLADLTASRFALDRPPWHVTLVDGFGDGSQALVTRFHHTLVDGIATLNVLSELFEDAAGARPPRAHPVETAPQKPPSPIWLFITTALRQVFVWLSLPWLLGRTVRRFRAVRRRREEAEFRVPQMSQDAPPTVLNISATNDRGLARARLTLTDVQAVRRAAGVTFSDVLVGVVAGALRTYLGGRGALPEEPLVVNVPLGNDGAGNDGVGNDGVGNDGAGSDGPARLRGNVFVNYYAVLPTDLPDPAQRLAATAAHAAEAKAQLEIQGRDTLTDWLDRIPPALAAKAARALAAQSRASENPPDFNVIVSNLKAPGGAWSCLGRAVETVFLTGPVTDGHGLNITVTGYGDQLTLAVHSNPAAVPDPEALARGLEVEMQVLLDAVTRSAAPSGVTPTPTTRTEVA